MLYRVNKKVAPATFVGTSAMRANFCMNSYTTFTQSLYNQVG